LAILKTVALQTITVKAKTGIVKRGKPGSTKGMVQDEKKGVHRST